MARKIPALVPPVLFAAIMLGTAGQSIAQEYHYAVEINGMVCGYARIVTSPMSDGARTFTRLTHELVVRGTLLGAPVDNRVTVTYHIDPTTNRVTYHESEIQAGPTRLTSRVRIDGSTARVSDGQGGPESIVALPDGVVLATSLRHPHLVADFVTRPGDRKTYQIFDGRDNAVRETTYTRIRTETVRLADETFQSVVLEAVEQATGSRFTMWLDTKTGIVLQVTSAGNRRSYLTDASIVDLVMRPGTRPNLDSTVLTKTNVRIRNLRAIAYMKVQWKAQPAGAWVTPESLNVPGQRFTGTVRDNQIEGIFEIQHSRYQGEASPAFPAAFDRDPALKPFLADDQFIQASDRVLAEKAREITLGSKDAWEAARRLSTWVAREIKAAIPGGVTARGTFDQRAGECGGHSFLFAALARGVGIPARVVWGAMYVPDGGGAFGQHAWNEVYMGTVVGWIPIDTTASEVDYVDSGHVRIGEVRSISTALNLLRADILDHRIGARAPLMPVQRRHPGHRHPG